VAHLVVVVPLEPEMVDRARELLAEGPPFDLDALGFDRHRVYLTGREAVFVFEGEDESAALELSAEDPALWEAASAWQECFSDRPRVARAAFSWERSEALRGVSFEPTPGPGDSEGGDLYPP
jgi:hypothetical protein